MTVPPPGQASGSEAAIRRRTARVLPVDDEGRVLLLHGWDPHHPEAPFWFTIGGAAEDGETMREAGARELYEETPHLGRALAPGRADRREHDRVSPGAATTSPRTRPSTRSPSAPPR